jgi:hypothetical protein
MRTSTDLPSSAAWLGAGGAVPFVVLGVSAPFLTDPHRASALFALGAYGAAILSFLGGVRWGLAIAAAATARDDKRLAGALTLSVVPSLVAWLALLLPPPASLWLLLVGFAAMLYLDVSRAHAGDVPAWYPRLRWPLSCLVLATLACGCLA